MAGAPKGNENRARGKRWAAAIERAVDRYPEKASGEDRSDLMKGIDAAADAFVAKMMADKDLGFFREFGDRVDGKPAQAHELSGPDGEPISVIERRVVGPKARS